MNIEKVFINGFGQLGDKELDFGNKINIIYGENEKGKSTLHRFMESMLYHPYKTGRSKRSDPFIINKYKPWGKSAYSGSMSIFDDDKYSIEKDFSSSRNIKISIFDNEGKEVSADYEMDSMAREPKFGYKHLGLSKVMFRNTVSIGQMGKGTDDEAVDEIKKYVSNIEETKDSTISVKDVVKKIDGKIDKIGRKTLSKSNYALREARIKELEKELKSSLEIADKIDDLQIKAVEVRAEKEKIEDKLASISKKLESISNLENNEIKKKADELFVKVNDSDKELAYLKSYEKFTYDKISDLKNIHIGIEKLELTNNSLKKDIDRLEKENVDLEGKTNFQSNIYELLDEKSALKEKIVNIRGLEGKNAEIEREILQAIEKSADLKEVKEPKKSVVLSIILVTMLLGFALMFVNNYLGLGIILAGIIITVLYWIRRTEKYKVYRVKEQRDKKYLEELENSLFDNSSTIKNIFAEYECEDIEQMDSQLDDISAKIAVLTDKADEAKHNREKKNEIVAELTEKKSGFDELDFELQGLYSRRDGIFSELGIDSFEGTEEGYLKNKRYDEVKQENEHLKQRLEELLAGKNYEDLEYKEVKLKVNIEDKDFVLEEKERITKRFIESAKQEEKVASNIASLERSIRSIQSFEEEIESLKAQKAEDDRSTKLLTSVKNRIEDTINIVQRTVMPEVNEVIGDIVRNVTDGKYDDVKVSGELDVYVSDTQNKKTVEIESLSAGTIDLLYVGLRIGMAGLFNGNKAVPIFFDDTFAQIDDKRLRNLLNYLASLDRQIFIFTCHRREDELLNDLGVEHRLIEL